MYCQDKGSTASKSKEGKLNADARFGAFPFPSRSRVDIPTRRSLLVFSAAFVHVWKRSEKEKKEHASE